MPERPVAHLLAWVLSSAAGLSAGDWPGFLGPPRNGVVTETAFDLRGEQTLEEAVGDEATALRERQTNVLTEAVKLTADLIEALRAKRDDRTEAETRELYDLMLNRGTMLASIGRPMQRAKTSRIPVTQRLAGT